MNPEVLQFQEGISLLSTKIAHDINYKQNLPTSKNKKDRTHVYCAIRCENKWIVARNTEVSAPCGSQCAERNGLAECANKGYSFANIDCLLLTSFFDDGVSSSWENRIILPCGVCRE
eukprot:PhF_6_TR26777/c0_g1_i1/m.39224